MKIGDLICSLKFLSPEVALYLYKFTILPCMEYWCHVGAVVPSFYLELSEKLQKQICRTVGPSLGASLEPLAHCRNIVHSVHSPLPLPPFLLGGVWGWGGVESQTKFSKRRVFTGSQFLRGGYWEKGGDFFQGGCSFYIKYKLKYEIFNNKKSL